MLLKGGQVRSRIEAQPITKTPNEGHCTELGWAAWVSSSSVLGRPGLVGAADVGLGALKNWWVNLEAEQESVQFCSVL